LLKSPPPRGEAQAGFDPFMMTTLFAVGRIGPQ